MTTNVHLRGGGGGQNLVGIIVECPLVSHLSSFINAIFYMEQFYTMRSNSQSQITTPLHC